MTDSTNPWLQFLMHNGARFDAGEIPELVGFGGTAGDAAPSDWVAPLTDLGLIAITGEDAVSFLHNQLTNDVEHLGTGEARLAGYCSPKGRLLASFLYWREGDAVLLQLPRELQPAIQKRLQMFVLRAKAKLHDFSAERAVLGLSGMAAASILTQRFPMLPAAPYTKVDGPAGSLLRVADTDGAPRWEWIAPLDTAQQAWPQLTQALTPVAPSRWRLADIGAGIPRITRATQEQFVPQMINFELIGGVNFKKGCYPGQEIVARSQYLGKLKRRMMAASVAAPDAAAGAEVFSSADPQQPCGMVVNAELDGPGHAACLVEIKLGALQEGSVHLGSANGPALRFGELPYPLTDPA